jgi:two-component system LytT family response regulator
MKEYISTVIVEDEINNAELLHHFLTKYCPQLIVEGIAKDLKEAKELIKLKKPKLLFLDIVLDHELSFDLLEDKDLSKTQIIFTTAFDKYALKAHKFNTIDYLLKPINIKELKDAVDRAIVKIEDGFILDKDLINSIKNEIQLHKEGEIKRIAISSQNDILLINQDDIISLTSNGKYTIFNFSNGQENVSSKNIGEYEKILNPNKFIRIHHSYMINIDHLIKIDKTKDYYCLLSNGSLLPVSKRKREHLKKMLLF